MIHVGRFFVILFVTETNLLFGTPSPEWERDLALLRRSSELGLPFESRNKRKMISDAHYTHKRDLNTAEFSEDPEAVPVESRNGFGSFYHSLVQQITRESSFRLGNSTKRARVAEQSAEASEAISHTLHWPKAVPLLFRKSYITTVRSDILFGERFAPDLVSSTLTESIPGLGVLALNTSVISATDTAVVFSVNHQPSVLKYQSDCPQDNLDVHPVLLDWWFLQHLEHLGITPKAYYVSPPSSMDGMACRSESRKLSLVRMSESDWLWCTQTNVATTVRFLIMEKVGDSLHGTMAMSLNQRIDLIQVVQLGISSIEAIRRLHEGGGVVHGDIHAGNICLHPTRQHEVVLIDFGKAFFVDEGIANDSIREPFSWVHALFSPWDILGKRPGKRDDVFKVLLTMALVLNGPKFTEWLTSIESNSTLSYEWKSQRNFFISPEFDFRKEIPETQGVEIENVFDEILRNVRDIPTPSHRPPYERIIQRLETINGILTWLELTSKREQVPEISKDTDSLSRG